jgi:lysozyme family protein
LAASFYKGEIVQVKDNFDKALTMLLHHEGGYVNSKKDPAGRTNLGVTQRTYEDWVGRKVDEAEMKALTVDVVTPLYKRNYWHAIRADSLPAGIDYYVFDAAVMSGTRQAVKWLQRALGVFDSGVVDLTTLSKAMNKDSVELIKEMNRQRLSYLQKLPSWNTYGKGWAKRLEEVEDAAIELVAAR